MSIIRIATRRSPLAMWQAQYVAQHLSEQHPQLQCELLPMRTQGDKLLDTPLAKVGGKGLFVKELERALLDGDADIAVHSMKDVPVHLPDGLVLSVILERADPRDALISPQATEVADLQTGSRLGTSSLRRGCQLKSLRPDIEIVSLRGGVDTRLAKLDSGDYDAILLACAGLDRMQLQDRIGQRIAPETLLPAIGQGAMGIECRRDDNQTRDFISVLHHGPSGEALTAERALNARLQGGCQVPIAGHAIHLDGQLWLRGLVASLDGREVLRADARAEVEQAEALGIQVAEALLAQGAGRILEAVYAEAQ